MASVGRRGIGAAVVRVCRRLDARGLIAGAEGNVSARVGPDRIVITPGGVTKADLRPGDLVTVGLPGGPRRPAANARQGRASATSRPSSELAMHLAIYAARPDVGAIVHAHPPAATGFAVARRPIRTAALAELAGVVGPVPAVPYRMPGTVALASAVAKGLANVDAVLLLNHGAVTVGRSCADALNRMESLEQAARILVTAHILGGVTELGHSDVIALERARAGGGRPAGKRPARRRGRRS